MFGDYSEDSQRAIGPLVDLTMTLERYRGTPFYAAFLQLSKSNAKKRAVKRNGDCFYLSVIFLILEESHSSTEFLTDLKNTLERLNRSLEESHVDKFVIEEFSSPIISLVAEISSGASVSFDEIDDLFWSYTSLYFRMIVSHHIKKHKEAFKNFLEEDVEVYCREQIEVPGCHTGEIEMASLALSLELSFDVVWLEQNATSVHTKGTGRKIGSLLYTPGHFEILYRDNK